MSKGIFITATDTDTGKTITSVVLGMLLQQKGIDVGVMKPVQCSGNDAALLKEKLDIKDLLSDINPFFAKDPLSPHIAFKKTGKKISIPKIKKNFKELCAKHDFVIVEGAGGLLVPIAKNYLMADLAKDLDLDIVVVSKLSLGTINHTLLTLSEARSRGLKICGVVFNESKKIKKGTVEKTNPKAICDYGHTKILGTIPYLNRLNKKEVLKKCKEIIDIQPLLQTKKAVSQDLKKKDKKYLWHPFTQMQDWQKEDPLIIEEAKGCSLKDSDGKWYLDGVSSLWVNLHGHRHPRVDEALSKQLLKVSHSTLLGLSNEPAVKLAEKLVKVAPRGLEKVFYSDSGSTAVEIAIKIAYQYWQNIGKRRKTSIVHFSNSYHGDTLGSVSVGGISLFHKVYRHLIFKAIKRYAPYPNAFGKKEEFEKDFLQSIESLERFMKERNKDLAALVVEPLVQGAAGMVVWPKGILRRVSQICKKYNVILVCDEVATGFGRTGKMFACEHEGVSPDILCLAKGISAGYLPLAATLTTQRIYNGFLFPYASQKTFFHGHTYTGNPLACAAGLANLEIFEKEKTLKTLQPKIKFLTSELQKFKKLSHVGDIRQKGFMVGIELVEDKKDKKEYSWEERKGIEVCQRVRDLGVILRPLGNVIVLMPPLSITKKELQKLCMATYRAIKEITENDERNEKK